MTLESGFMNKKTAIGIACVLAAGVICSAAAHAEKAPTETAAPAESVSRERIYSVASISKVYSTAAVMQLVDEGKVDLDAPVTRYIPDFTMADERYKDITVRMLMNHTSGMEGSCGIDDMLYGDNDSISLDTFLDSLKNRRLKADPGEYAAYCNDGFCLLHMIVENVTGMSFTDYLRENISGRIGAEHTGTPFDMYDNADLAQIYCFGNVPHEYEYDMGLGSGGICSTASDVAEFGGTFFTGNDTLISESAKNAMATRRDGGANEYEDENGLGWDYVEKLHYEQAGIKVMGKGGDLSTMHSHLLVAPDEEISVAVLSAGGSSTYDQMMAEALLDVVLEERGKTVDKSYADITLADGVPAQCRKYEGYYALCMSGVNGVARIYFDDGYMYTSALGTGNSSPARYKPTADGGFVKVDDSGNITAEREVLRFEERDGKVYVKSSSLTVCPGLGESESKTYCGERIEENPVSDSAANAWAERADRPMALYNAKYSSTNYDIAFMTLRVTDELKGYVIVTIDMGESYGVIMGVPLKIIDENRAEFFTSTPSSASRDLYDITVGEELLLGGTKTQIIKLSDGKRLRFADELPELTGDVTEIQTGGGAAWYRIGADMGGGSITAERPEHSVIYVYNKYREMIYTTNVTDAPEDIPLPPDGYIMFHGETGDSVKIFS